MSDEKPKRLIGIDPGTNTGLAIWDFKKLTSLQTTTEFEAMETIKAMQIAGFEIFVIFEDARQRKWFGKDAAAKAQGAGAVKSSCAKWEVFLKSNKIPFRAQPPIKGGTKLNKNYFELATGWAGKSSEHSRDAAWMVFQKTESWCAAFFGAKE